MTEELKPLDPLLIEGADGFMGPPSPAIEKQSKGAGSACCPPANAFDTGVDTGVPKMIFDQGAKKFWWQNRSGEWIGRDRKTAQDMLKQHHGMLGSADRGEKLSQVDREILEIMENQYVTYAGPLAGWKKGIYEEQGQRFLVTRSPALPEPTPGEWPTIYRMFACLLAGTEISEDEAEDSAIVDQRPFLYAWWRHSLQCLLECFPDHGLALVLAGDAGCGKTLLKEMIRISFGGREQQPYSYMIGRDNFNAELIEAETWSIDDETADTKMIARVKFGAELKKVIANASMRFRGMMREAFALPTFKRLVICVNREPDRLLVLPPMDDDIRGKVLLLLGYNSEMFSKVEHHSTVEKKAFWETLNEELPHFMHWVLYTWERPASMDGRFGSREYHHPDLTQELFTLSPEQILLEQIGRLLAPWFECAENEYWCGSAEDLHALFLADDAPLSASEVKRIRASNWLGKDLKKLAKKFPNRFQHKKTATGNLWTIFEN